MIKRHKPLPPPPPGDKFPIGMLVNELSKMFLDRLRAEAENAGMQGGFRHLLFHLAREDGITQLDLARYSHLKAPTVSVALQKMEHAGLVTRQTDSNDARQTIVYLTDKGRELDAKVRERIDAMEKLLLKGVTQDDEAKLRELLLKMRENIS